VLLTIAAPVTATLIGFTTATPVTGQHVSSPTVDTVLFALPDFQQQKALAWQGQPYPWVDAEDGVGSSHYHVLRDQLIKRPYFRNTSNF
jgi:hypothetical protein